MIFGKWNPWEAPTLQAWWTVVSVFWKYYLALCTHCGPITLGDDGDGGSDGAAGDD